MERNWETQIIGQWLNPQGYTLLIDSKDNNTFRGDFCFKVGSRNKKIPINGVIMPNENDHWPLVFMINWGLYFEGVEGFTCFQIDWNKSNKGISFDMQWTKVVNGLNGQYIVSDVLHFCQFDFKLPSQPKKWDNPVPQIMNKSPIPTTDFPSPFTKG